ncbi:MAG: hypothetical protein LLF96_13495 [Eubacteriales bacterium]|nr:hypothetical protein [Eubacteriales bacterium]
MDESLNTKASVVALGMFDGVHIGHRELLRNAREVARHEGVPLVVQTFATHPLCVLDPGRCPPLLTTPEERARLIEVLGVNIYCAQPFTMEISQQQPEDFVRELVKRWHPVAVVVGFNYTFGSGGIGTPALLQKLGKSLRFKTIVVPAVRFMGNTPVSATQIRTELAAGRVLTTRFLLGRLYAREVTLVKREGERCELQWIADEKQTPAATDYYALLGDGRHTYPVLVRVRKSGTILCQLSDTLVLGNRLTLRLIEEKVERDTRQKPRGKKGER